MPQSFPREVEDGTVEALDLLPRPRSIPPTRDVPQLRFDLSAPPPAPSPAPSPPVAAEATPRRRNRARAYLLAGALVAAAGVLAFRALHAGTETTDHATVAARVVTIAGESSGTVSEVLVQDHGLVEKGAPLLRLDPAAARARVAGARAALASAEAMLDQARKRAGVVGRQVDTNAVVARGDETAALARQRSLEAEAARAQAAVDAAVVSHELATKELERVRTLHAQRSVSDVHVDEARARASQAEAELRRARALVVATTAERTAALGFREAATGRVKLSTTGAEVGLAHADVELASARVDEAKAGLELAEIELRRTTVTAPMRGVIEKRRVDPGTFVTPGTELLVLVSTDDVWIDAEFKESQIGKLARGQAADVEIDALSGRRIQGHVESVGGATVARTSLLQASGNGFARATQRVPVRIALEQRPDVALPAGLNATVTVHVVNR